MLPVVQDEGTYSSVGEAPFDSLHGSAPPPAFWSPYAPPSMVEDLGASYVSNSGWSDEPISLATRKGIAALVDRHIGPGAGQAIYAEAPFPPEGCALAHRLSFAKQNFTRADKVARLVAVAMEPLLWRLWEHGLWVGGAEDASVLSGVSSADELVGGGSNAPSMPPSW